MTRGGVIDSSYLGSIHFGGEKAAGKFVFLVHSGRVGVVRTLLLPKRPEWFSRFSACAWRRTESVINHLVADP